MKKLSLLISGIAIATFISCNQNTDNAPASEAVNENEASQPRGQESVNDDVSQKDVVQVALGSKDHTTLVAALKQADLVEVLKKSGPFTVFAPTNAAFDKLPKGTVEDLMKPEKKWSGIPMTRS